MPASPASTAAAAAAAAVPIPPILHAVAGSIGSGVALFLTYPLERARIDMQQQCIMMQQENDVATIIPKSGCENLTSTRARKTLSRGGSVKASKPEVTTDSPSDSWSVIDEQESKEEQQFLQQESAESISSVEAKLTLSRCFQRLWERHELYQGVAPLVLTLSASNFVFFYLHELFKTMLLLPTNSPQHRKNKNNYRSLVASCLAGVCNVLITNPLWVANLRIVTGEATSNRLFLEIRHLVQSHGVVSLWQGTWASLLLVSNPVLQFFLYEQLKGSHASLEPLQAFVTGAMAKAVATVLTYPLQLAQAVLRMQTDDKNVKQQQNAEGRTAPCSGTWDCLVKLYGKDGVEGLFTGMRAKLLQTVLTAAFTFLTYEQIVTVLHTSHQAFLAKRQRRGGVAR